MSPSHPATASTSRALPPPHDTADTRSPKERQRIGEHELAFWRAVRLEGLDMRQMADRYLPGVRDSRLALNDITRRLARAASLHPRAKRVPRIFERLPPTEDHGKPTLDHSQPTLQEFAQSFPADFYTEAELQQLFLDAYPPTKPQSTDRTRYIRQAARALNWLRFVAVDTPQPHHRLSAWLARPIADRLQHHGIHTLADLAQRIDAHGARWHVGLAGVGPVKAKLAATWLLQNVPQFAQHVGARAIEPIRALQRQLVTQRQARAGQIAPYESFIPPPALTGARKVDTHQADALDARDDAQAIDRWMRTVVLHKVFDDPTQRDAHPVYRAYRREVERLWNWATLEQGRALSDLTDADVHAYASFLTDPQPCGRWVGPPRPRWHPEWRPFQGPLTDSGQRYALTVIGALFQFLTEQRYLARNPWRTLRRAPPPAREAPTARALPPTEWEAVRAAIAKLPEDVAGLRLRAALAIMSGCGLRISEACALRCGDFKIVHLSDGPAIELNIRGKGEKVRDVPLPEHALRAIARLLAARGLPDDALEAPPDTPILPAFATRRGSGTRPWSQRAAYQEIKTIFRQAAATLQRTHAAKHLAAASPHWLRHTFATEVVANRGTPLPTAAAILGHASVTTTAAYSRGAQEHAHSAVRGAGAALALE